jgi:hypothetical protein
MAESPLQATDLKTQYAAQLTTDLERNAKEQDRIGADLVALQEQLDTLRHDQTLLVSMQRALGTDGTTAVREPDTGDAPAVPAPRQAPSGRRTRARKQASAPGRTSAGADSPTSTVKAAKAPTLGELIREYLVQQAEPRSAAEVTEALAQSHPERGAKGKVVRMALEGLVAKSHIQRIKQNKSVFYSALGDTPDAESSAAAVPDEAVAADPA